MTVDYEYGVRAPWCGDIWDLTEDEARESARSYCGLVIRRPVGPVDAVAADEPCGAEFVAKEDGARHVCDRPKHFGDHARISAVPMLTEAAPPIGRPYPR